MLIFDIKIMPNSGKQEFVLDKNNKLKCYLKNLPEKNKANFELIKLLAKKLKITQNEIRIVSGSISRYKKIELSLDINYLNLLNILNLNIQNNIFNK